MADNNFINDADIAFGSRDITIGSTVYPTEDFKLDFEVNRIVSHGSTGLPRGKVIQRGEKTGSFTCVLPTAASLKPKMGDTFTTVEETVSLSCYIEKVGKALTANGETKIPCTFSVAIGTVVVS